MGLFRSKVIRTQNSMGRVACRYSGFSSKWTRRNEGTSGCWLRGEPLRTESEAYKVVGSCGRMTAGIIVNHKNNRY